MAQRGGQRQKSEYGLQLAEKQKIRNEYGLREKQFRGYFSKGKDSDGIYGFLEMRLDNAVYRSGLTITRPAARQMVNHGHIIVNGKKVDIPSYQVKVGDVISVREQSKDKGTYTDYQIRLKKFEPPSWLVLDKKIMSSKVLARPDTKQVHEFDFQAVIEFYNR